MTSSWSAAASMPQLGPLLIWAVALSFLIPVAAIMLFGKRAVTHPAP